MNLDEFAWSPYNFRFQAFDAAKAPNTMKVHFSLLLLALVSRCEITTMSTHYQPGPLDIPRPAVTIPLFFPTTCASCPANHSQTSPEARSGVASIQLITYSPLIHSIPQRHTGASIRLFLLCFFVRKDKKCSLEG